MRLFCKNYFGAKNPDSCHFVISFSFDSVSQKWSITDPYSTANLIHQGHSIALNMEE